MPKTQNVMGFSGSVNGTTKNPGFLDFGFCQCKWAYSLNSDPITAPCNACFSSELSSVDLPETKSRIKSVPV